MEQGQSQPYVGPSATSGGGQVEGMREKAREKVLEGLDRQKVQVSEVLRKVASTLDEGGPVGAMFSGYVRRGGEYVRDHSADQLLKRVGSAVRERPELAALGCLAGGFALARIFRS